MNIAELFVSLGIKGSDKTVASLSNVEKGLKQTASMSLEAKAAIVGAMFALEQFFAKSGAAGTDLTNFNNVLGVSAQTLQEYQYAARQVGISNSETEGTFKTLQATMTKMKLGEGAPKGFAQVANLTGGLTAQDVDKFMQNPELLLQRLSQYAQKEKRVGIRNEVLKSFGIGDNMIAALTRNAFRPDVLTKAPTYSDREIKSLDKANIAWSNLSNKIAMAIGHLNASHGGQIVKDFTILVDLGVKFADAIFRVTDGLQIFEGLDRLFTLVEKDGGAVLSTIGRFAIEFENIGQKSKVFENIENFVQKGSVEAESFIATLMNVAKGIADVAQKFELLSKLGKIFSDVVTIGGNLLGIILKIDTAILDLVQSLKLFDKVGAVLSKVLEGIGSVTGGVASVLSEANGTPEEREKLKTEAKNTIPELPNMFKALMGEIVASANNLEFPEKSNESNNDNLKTVSSTATVSDNSNRNGIPPSSTPTLRLVVPPSPLLPESSKINPKTPSIENAKPTAQNVNVNQTLNFAHEGKNSKDTGDSVKRAVQQAFRQLSSQVQGT